MDQAHYEELTAKAEALVKERIAGTRKGLPDQPNYLHSYRVRDLVVHHAQQNTSDFDLFLAALLHDIVEDSDTTLEELKSFGFSDRTLQLVDLCSHRLETKDGSQRWVLMIARLVEAGDVDAWRIKLADLTDNLKQSVGLSLPNRRFMVETKAPLLIRLAKALPFSRWITEEPPYVQPSIFALEEEMKKQRQNMAQM